VALAEQLTVLDQVSGGRLDVGIGRGGIGTDYVTFGVDYADSRAREEEGPSRKAEWIWLPRLAGSEPHPPSASARTPNSRPADRMPNLERTVPPPRLSTAWVMSDGLRARAIARM